MRGTNFWSSVGGFAPTAEFDRMVQRFMGEAPTSKGVWEPHIAIWEDSDKTYVELDIPGVAREDVEIVVESNQLRISGVRNAPERRQYRYNDRRYGRFSQTFRLSSAVDSESVSAELNGGTLAVSLAKKAEALAKRIEVKTA